MCGIAGIAWDDRQLARRMARLVQHRGPDSSGTYNDRHCTLAHQRLAIIDLSERAKQPMTGEDRTVWVAFVGEIYNWKDLRQKLETAGHRFNSDSDTETIVHGYEQHGDGIFRMLEGDFALAIYDAKKKKLTLARDRVGVKPLYYAFVKGRLAFASEIKALLAVPGVKREVNSMVFDRYLMLRYPFGRETMFDGINRVLPGEMIVHDCASRRTSRKRYWSIAWQPEEKSEPVMVAELRKALKESVERQLMSDVPLGAYLSGGIDSGSVVSLMSRISDSPVKTFSVGFGSEDSDELKHARLVSDYWGTDHKEIIISKDTIKLLPEIIWHTDEPIADPAMIPVYVLSREAKKDVTVVLTGDGGDELFAGYEQYKFLRLAQRARKIPGLRGVMRAGLALTNPKLLNSVFRYAGALGSRGTERARRLLATDNPAEQYLAITAISEASDRSALAGVRQTAENDVKAHFTNGNVIDDALKFEFEVQLPENMLMKSDKMIMAHAVEPRVPLLDAKVIDVARRIPFSWKLRGRTEKYIFRKAIAPWVPKETVKRKKQRFYVPIDHWLKESAPVLDRVFSPSMMRHGLLDRHAVQKIRDNYRQAPLFYARQLWTLLTFQLWYERFIL